MKKNPKNKKGFVLLVAVLISVVIFSIGIGFSTIVYKELVLSFTARDSQKALYTADMAVECIRYWDNWRRDVRFTSAFESGGPSQIECNDIVYSVGTNRTDIFFDDQNGSDYCVHGEIRKVGTGQDRESLVSAWGFTSCSEGRRRIDRAFDLRYPTL